MRTIKIGVFVAAGLAALFMMTGHFGRAQTAAQSQVDSNQPRYLEWPLPTADRAYGAIDGKHLWQYVVEQAAISRRYRDQGHPQFWGRIIGTSGDVEDAQWLAEKYQRIGMTDIHIQPFDLQPQWMPQSWAVTVEGGAKTLSLSSAQPAYHTNGTQGQGLDLEAVYVELGSEADYAGLDVRGKAVFIARPPVGSGLTGSGATAGNADALKRAETKGAAVIFNIDGFPGNLKYQSYPANTNVPTFSLGTQDGDAVRDLIEGAPAGQAPRVHVRLDVQMVPNLKTALVWGTLPGATDETIYVIAHRDGWFDASGDNGGGVAGMLGVAEYFAKIPQSQRHRTMVFIGLDGHHNSGLGASVGTNWLADQKQLFTKTALVINDEHPADVITYRTPAPTGTGQTDEYIADQWYAGGPSRPELRKIAADAFREFGVPTWAEPSPRPPAGDLGRFASFVPGVIVQSNDFLYMHTDGNTPETVPWTGLEATTRAYAKIIDQVNKLDLQALQRPPEVQAPRGSGPAPSASAVSTPQATAQLQGSTTAEAVTAAAEPDNLEWPLLASDRSYRAIDGRHIWQYVVEQVAISRRYRDQGHPQFWGRIIGTSADAEDARWLLENFQRIGMTDTHIQPVDLAPQWMPQSWAVTAEGGGKTMSLTSAQPTYRTPGTQSQGLDLEAVYVGLGREADFARHDVRGKAAVVFVSSEGVSYGAEQLAALKRAAAHGAAAILAVNVALPAEVKIQSYPVDTSVPTFSLALKDGQAVRDLIAGAPAGQPPHLRVSLDVQMVPNEKTALVWGTLPGATDEKIYVIAHRDGWFDAASDNAGGVASMLGLAEYYAKIPQRQRRRTMVFVGLDGHHNTGAGAAAGETWMVAQKDRLFAKTALMINAEHPSNVVTYRTPTGVGQTDAFNPLEWYAGGPSRPELRKIAVDAFQEFGVNTWAEPSAKPPAGDLGRFFGFLPGVVVQSNDFFYMHTDANTPETVPWTALEAVTRAYAKIIDQVNKLELKDLQRPVEP